MLTSISFRIIAHSESCDILNIIEASYKLPIITLLLLKIQGSVTFLLRSFSLVQQNNLDEEISETPSTELDETTQKAPCLY
jgi:hypothetical protein